jgi:hypothetical protein
MNDPPLTKRVLAVAAVATAIVVGLFAVSYLLPTEAMGRAFRAVLFLALWLPSSLIALRKGWRRRRQAKRGVETPPNAPIEPR